MISSELVQQAKSVAIEAYLSYKGHQPVYASGHRLLYHSPFRQESTPSFWVNRQINRFKDFGSQGERGDDIIQLVQRLHNCTFAVAITELDLFVSHPPKPDFSFSGPSKPAASGNQIKSVKLLNNPHLIRYVESRRISYAIARRYCREVYYVQGEKNLFAIGFENDQGGYALRNGIGAKRNIGPAYYTTIQGKKDTAVNVFEGFFDFLSALEFYGLSEPNCTSIILNSTTNLEVATPALKGFSLANAYFDRDKTGWATLDAFKSIGLPVTDRSDLYRDYNDLNEFWCSSATR